MVLCAYELYSIIVYTHNVKQFLNEMIVLLCIYKLMLSKCNKNQILTHSRTSTKCQMSKIKTLNKNSSIIMFLYNVGAWSIIIILLLLVIYIVFKFSN